MNKKGGKEKVFGGGIYGRKKEGSDRHHRASDTTTETEVSRKEKKNHTHTHTVSITRIKDNRKIAKHSKEGLIFKQIWSAAVYWEHVSYSTVEVKQEGKVEISLVRHCRVICKYSLWRERTVCVSITSKARPSQCEHWHRDSIRDRGDPPSPPSVTATYCIISYASAGGGGGRKLPFLPFPLFPTPTKRGRKKNFFPSSSSSPPKRIIDEGGKREEEKFFFPPFGKRTFGRKGKKGGGTKSGSSNGLVGPADSCRVFLVLLWSVFFCGNRSCVSVWRKSYIMSSLTVTPSSSLAVQVHHLLYTHSCFPSFFWQGAWHSFFWVGAEVEDKKQSSFLSSSFLAFWVQDSPMRRSKTLLVIGKTPSIHACMHAWVYSSSMNI